MKQNEDIIFQGSFDNITVGDLLEFIVEFEMTGKLVLNEEAIIVFEKGDPNFAKFSYVKGLEAVQQILKNYWEYFYFSRSYDRKNKNVILSGDTLINKRNENFPNERRNKIAIDYSQNDKYSNSMLEFYSNLIHEMGNPLTIIRGSTQMTERHVSQNADVPDSIKDYVSQMSIKITNQVERFNKLLGSARMLSKPRSRGEVKYNAIEVIQKWVENAKKNLNESVQLHFNTEINIAFLFGEPDELIQILSNLLDNSEQACLLSKNNQKNIVIYIAKKKDKLLIYIEDNGIGIDDEEKHKIFNAFYSKFKDQSGLGLNVVKAIVNRINGEIIVNSKLGEGVEIILKIPIEK